ncbi:MAG TPA: cytochrome c oxidase subunit II [Nevskiaceae bacterium]
MAATSAVLLAGTTLDNPDKDALKMLRSHRHWRRWIGGTAALAGLLVSLSASANPHDWQINMPHGVTPMSQQIWDLHMAAFWVCVALGIGVFGAMFIEILRFRKSKGAVASGWHGNKWVEITWTAVPLLILIGLAAPATILTREIYDSHNSEMTVKVTGYQWLWSYNYISYDGKSLDTLPTVWSRLAWNSNKARQLDSGIDPWSIVAKPRDIAGYKFKGGFHDYLLNVTHPLVIPDHTKVRFLITSDDVVHGWGVPDFGIKKAAIPGMMNDAWATVDKPGIYRGQCYVLCGQDHSAMPIVVVVLPRANFQKWLAEQKQAGKGAAPTASESASAQPQRLIAAAAPEK